MSIIINGKALATGTPIATSAPNAQADKRKSCHTKPRAPTISLDQPGRLRVAHVLSLLGIAHSTLYEGMRYKRYPRPDGRDGRIPYWHTETIRNFLKAPGTH